MYTVDSALGNRAENREKIRHKAGEWVRADVHTNGIESSCISASAVPAQACEGPVCEAGCSLVSQRLADE